MKVGVGAGRNLRSQTKICSGFLMFESGFSRENEDFNFDLIFDLIQTWFWGCYVTFQSFDITSCSYY